MRDRRRQFLLEHGLLAFGEGAPSLESKKNLLVQAQSAGIPDADITSFLVENLDHLGNETVELRAELAGSAELLQELTAEPHPHALCLGVSRDERGGVATVVHDGGPTELRLHPDLDPDEIEGAGEVLLNRQRNLVLRAIIHPIFTGDETAVFWGWMPDGRLRLELRDQDLSAHATAPLKKTDLQEGDLVEIQRRHGVTIALSRLEPRNNSRWLLAQPPDMDFSAVRGYDELVDQIRGPLELQLFHPEAAVRNHVEHAYGIILFGRPGNGKTHVVRALAGWLNRTSGGKAGFIHVRPGELASMWFGESQRLIRELFASARKHAAEAGGPCVVFLDELDSIGAARSFGSSAPENRVSQALMAEIDGLEPRGNVVVIGTTNRLDALDPAITRSGRFGDNFIEVKGPNREAARHLIDHYLPESLPFRGGANARPGFVDALLTSLYAPNGDTKLSRILFREGSQEVNVADLISCADIKKICKQAALANARREAEGVQTGIAAEDLLSAADREKDRLASLLTPHNTRNYMTGLPMDVQVVRVERLRDQTNAKRRRYLRIAEAA